MIDREALLEWAETHVVHDGRELRPPTPLDAHEFLGVSLDLAEDALGLSDAKSDDDAPHHGLCGIPITSGTPALIPARKFAALVGRSERTLRRWVAAGCPHSRERGARGGRGTLMLTWGEAREWARSRGCWPRDRR